MVIITPGLRRESTYTVNMQLVSEEEKEKRERRIGLIQSHCLVLSFHFESKRKGDDVDVARHSLPAIKRRTY
jgi:hypothetical protein